nr:hypothetical protein [Tanacetum cinerariifolium]
IVLSVEDNLDYLEQPILSAPVPAQAGQQVAPEALATHVAWVKGSNEIELKTLFAQQAEHELLQTVRDFHSCKQEEGQFVSFYVLKMKSYIDNLKRLGHPISLNLEVSLILISLRKEFDSFIQNDNMHGIGKTVNELHAMLKLHEQTLTKKDHALHVIRAGKVQKNNKQKKPKLAARGQNQKKEKNKLAYVPKPKIHHPPKRENPAKDLICHQCGDTCHWKRNCPKYLAGLLKNKKLSQGVRGLGIFIMQLYTFPNKSWVCDTGCGTHICNTTQGLGRSRKLKPGALSLYVDNDQRATVEAIGSFHLCLLISRNNLVYFSVVPRDGIFETDLSNSNTNDSSMYDVRNKRAKLNLDSALLLHCHLGHISKKHIKKSQHDGLLNSTDFRDFEKCVSCMSGKMARKPYTHQVERAKDLLRLIHTNKEVENQLGKTIKSLHSDHGDEYMSQEFLDHLQEHKIIAHRIPPYTPQHNDVLDRRNKTLLDMVRFMMSQTTLPKSFWDYALETVARILNMVPTKKVKKTPYEV